MANVDIRVGKKDAVFFAANPTLILKDGQFLFNSDTLELFIGDGTTQLSSLVAINGGSSITPNLQEVTDEGYITTNPIVTTNGVGVVAPVVTADQFQTTSANVTVTDSFIEVLKDDSSSALLEVDRATNSIKKLGVDIATVNDIPSVDTTIIDGSTNPVDGNAVFDALATKYSKGCTLVFTHSALNPADGVSYFFGCFLANSANSTSTALRRGFAPLTGSLFNGIVHVQVGSTLGTTETSTIKINNLTQATSTTLTTAVQYDVISAGFPFELVTPFAVNSGDVLEIQVDMPTFATNPASVLHLVTLIFGVK